MRKSITVSPSACTRSPNSIPRAITSRNLALNLTISGGMASLATTSVQVPRSGSTKRSSLRARNTAR
ncbi:hypothetical protein PMIN01_00459 [Paraphaeosphaeria minitans]|uniref:Uncharacterized protein n=1 Tax=Paraphaeosphaeria minitans TaxID=565426 RepID=A0A9P6KW09_9PLEO|nr:hypothetical protein PMIN01_00459 [Paraphaeosphaeria minitans]